MRRALPLLVVSLLLAVLGLSTPWGRAAVDATRLLFALAVPPAPVHPRVMEYGSRRADLYGEAGPVVILLPGAARTGKDDVRLVRFASALVAAGRRVMVPEPAGAKALTLSAEDAEDVAEAVRHAPAGGRAAVIALSYAAVPAVLALLDPDLAGRVGVVLAVGPPYDARRVIGFFTTGFVGTRRLEPNVYGKWVFVSANAARLSDSGDRVLLEALARRKMADPAAGAEDLTARLGPQGRAVAALLDNADPARVAGLVEALPMGLADEIARLDLSRRDLSGFGPELLVLHGADDRIVPVEEGEALAAAVPRGRLFRPDRLAHADLTLSGLEDAVILWWAAHHLFHFSE